MQTQSLRTHDIERPQLFDVSSQDALVSLFLQLGSVVFLTGNNALSHYTKRPYDLSRFVHDRLGVREERTGRIAYQQRAVGPCDRTLRSVRDGWEDLCPSGESGYHVIGMDEERCWVFAFRSVPNNHDRKHQLCYAAISVADRPIVWLPLSRPPEGTSTFLDASRFVREVRDGELVGVKTIVRLMTLHGFVEHRLLTIEASFDGPIARWSDPFRAEHSVLGPDWRGVPGSDATELPPALLLQECGENGYAIHRMPLRDCGVQQLYAYLLSAGHR